MQPRFPSHPATPGIAQLRARIAQGQSSVSDTLAEARARIVADDPTVHAFTVIAEAPHTVPDATLPLAGVALGVKDLYDTAGMETAYGSPIYAGHVPSTDAALVALLCALGARVAGKTVTTEFAWREAGPTVNPWHAAHTPGGSSSGSAAAVAAGLVPLATGTQTFGSIIRPASFCGIVGFKPSWGLLPLAGVQPLSPTLDHAGLFTRDVAGMIHVFAPLTGQNIPPRTDPPRLRLVRGPFWDRAEPAQQQALLDAAARLAAQGATVTEAELPAETDTAFEIAQRLLFAEAHAIYAPLNRTHPGQLSAHMLALVEAGAALTEHQRTELPTARARLQRRHATAMMGYDAILTLPALGEAPLLDEGTGDGAPCVPWTLIGAPAIALPHTHGPRGLPLGIQLVGRSDDDAGLLSVAAWCEAATLPG